MQCTPPHDWQNGFLKLLPAIERKLRFCFRDLDGEALDEAVQEGTVDALFAYKRLLDRGKQLLAFPTVLAHYAARHFRDGRPVAVRQSVRDVFSAHCQIRKGVRVERLHRYNPHDDCWRDVLVEDRKAGPAETAAVRIDFQDFLKSLNARDRRIALTLATGETTSRVAELFRLSKARISMLRRELMDRWHAFQGEVPVPADAVA